ncbi:zinc finger and SCAN domain-containing protein 32 isoform X1 [Canis lupus familiaris]|uniref:zinc finger and SCAN domain-containing protein 32 isoform X1 n=2 Tax=Canis lupus familiaris TaxID=9615 RepID=UPI0018F5CC07|nr:zinc finger and SCAN domain-containing protein 32 isoform X1 [Canis lupus familiaris]XP_038396536.1 zinc finger and SCAN domain-containing protein 32 isoform X1 [Canis lupus familiaris]
MPTVGEWNLMKQKPQVLVVVLRLYYAHTHLGGMLRHASCPPARSFRFSAGRWSQGRCLVTGSQCCWTVTPLRAPARGSGPPPEAVFSPRTWPRRGVLRPGDRHWLSAAGAQGPVPCEDRAVSLCQEGQTHVGFAQRALYKGVTWKKDRKNSLGLEIKNKTKKENQKWDGLGQAEAKKTLWRKSSETFWRPEPKRGQKGEPLLRGQWKCPAGEQEGRPPSQERWSQQILRAGEKAYAHVLSLGDGSWGSPCLHQPVAQVEKSSKCQQCGKSFS